MRKLFFPGIFIACLMLFVAHYRDNIIFFYDLAFPADDLFDPVVIDTFDFWLKDNSASFEFQCKYKRRWYEIILDLPFEDGLTTPDIMGAHKMDIGGWYKIAIKENGHITLDETIDGLPESSYWGSDSSPLRRRLSLLRFFIKDCNNISINISVVEEANNFQKLRDFSRLLVHVSPMK